MNPPIPSPRRMERRTSIKFSLNTSTASQYSSSDRHFYGPYAHIRQILDYSFHNNYTKERQWLQDSIIDKLLNEIVTGKKSNKTTPEDPRSRICSMPTDPWLVYVAGSEKANRAMTIQYLLDEASEGSVPGQSRFPLFGFVLVDSREIEQLLPDFQCYAKSTSVEDARELTRKEVGYISEIVTRAALQAGSNVLIYGALRNSNWHREYFPALKTDFELLKIGILHIVAREGEIEMERQRVKKVITALMPNIDFFCKLQSSSSSQDIKILTKGITWKSFRTQFVQESAFVETTIPKLNEKHRGESGFIQEFSLDLSTEENYQTSSMKFYGPYAHIRKKLDYTYHRNYKRERQMLQDAIIEEMLNTAKIVDANSGQFCTTPTEPWLVFTAGAMGAGKSYTLRKMHENGRFPLPAFVIVDPDEIRQIFPEYSLYVAQNPKRAGEMTRKEAGYIVEILTLSALQAGKNVLVDGSLRDSEWYSTYFDKLKKDHGSLKIAILHIVAPRSAVFARAKVSRCFPLLNFTMLTSAPSYHGFQSDTFQARGEMTGRVIPTETLQLSLQQVPKSVEILQPKVDYFCELNNAPCVNEIEIMTDGVNWTNFASNWLQTCAWIPKSKKAVKTLMV
jgi:uncharacterized phage-like protein YoqJ